MMKLTIAKSIFSKYNLSLGIVIARGINNKTDKDFMDLVKEQENKIRNEFKDKKPSELPQIKVWREAYSSFGAKPKKYKSSIEALYTRVLDGESLPSINSLVNIYNFLSIKNILPLGGDDLDKIDGNIKLTFAQGNEKFQPLGETETTSPKPGEVVYKDDKDILCRRWNWRECDKSKLTEKTKNCILYTESLIGKGEAEKTVKELAKLIKENLGGEVQTFIISKNMNELDLDTVKLTHSDFDEAPPEKQQEQKPENKKSKKTGQRRETKLEFYHWADNYADQIIKQKGEKDQYVLAAGITPSGTIHMGNFREIITVDLIKRALEDQNKKVRFIYSWDDNDVFRKVPKNLPQQDKLKTFLRKPIFAIPDPFNCHDSYSEHFEKEMEKDLPEVDINPEFIYQNKEYSKCQYAEGIKIALEKTPQIIEILNQYRKEPLEQSWLPIFVFCKKCGKDTTSEIKWDKNYQLDYKCECGHQDSFDFRKKGIVTLRWRIDWPMRWWFEKVDFESGGKDHFAAGGSVETGRKISKEIYNYEPPFGFPYEWISIKGGLQFASSAGIVITLKEMLGVYQPEIIRYLFASTRPNADFSISFDVDAIKIYEDYDKTERIYYGLEKVSEKEFNKQKRIYELSSINQPSKQTPLQWSFRHLTTVLQIHQLDIEKTIGFYEKELKNKEDKQRLHQRAVCAKNWLEKHAPGDFRFSVQEKPPKLKLDKNIKEAVQTLAQKLKQRDWTDVDLHNEIYILTQNFEIKPADFFKTIYQIIINKERGPRLASFILQIGKDKVIDLLKKV